MSREKLALWLLEVQSDDDDYPAAMEKIGLKLLEQADALGQEQARVENLKAGMKTLRDTSSNIPRWVRELARTALEIAEVSNTDEI